MRFFTILGMFLHDIYFSLWNNLLKDLTKWVFIVATVVVVSWALAIPTWYVVAEHYSKWPIFDWMDLSQKPVDYQLMFNESLQSFESFIIMAVAGLFGIIMFLGPWIITVAIVALGCLAVIAVVGVALTLWELPGWVKEEWALYKRKLDIKEGKVAPDEETDDEVEDDEISEEDEEEETK